MTPKHQDAAKNVLQRFEVNGLFEESVGPEAIGFKNVTVQARAGHNDDGDNGASRMFP